MLHAVEFVMIRNKAIVEMIQPSAAYGTNKTALVKNVVFNSNTFQDINSFATLWLVTTACEDH